MIKRYQSDYSNELHQLIVTPSKHYYITARGALKYQKKPFEIRLENLDAAKKTHTIHFLLRDHFSGLFYWEICSSSAVIPIYEFLFRAWSKKSNHPLYGIPDYMTIPKSVQSYFPALLGFIEEMGVVHIKVTSGFQGGIRDIRTVEDALAVAGFYLDDAQYSKKDPEFERVSRKSPEIYSRFIDSPYNRPTKKEVWMSGIASKLRTLTYGSVEDFKELYVGTQQSSAPNAKSRGD